MITILNLIIVNYLILITVFPQRDLIYDNLTRVWVKFPSMYNLLFHPVYCLIFLYAHLLNCMTKMQRITKTNYNKIDAVAKSSLAVAKSIESAAMTLMSKRSFVSKANFYTLNKIRKKMIIINDGYALSFQRLGNTKQLEVITASQLL